jgi:hypothetical protein
MRRPVPALEAGGVTPPPARIIGANLAGHLDSGRDRRRMETFFNPLPQ